MCTTTHTLSVYLSMYVGSLLQAAFRIMIVHWRLVVDGLVALRLQIVVQSYSWVCLLTFHNW